MGLDVGPCNIIIYWIQLNETLVPLLFIIWNFRSLFMVIYKNGPVWGNLLNYLYQNFLMNWYALFNYQHICYVK